jgi:hypothetical protein
MRIIQSLEEIVVDVEHTLMRKICFVCPQKAMKKKTLPQYADVVKLHP